MHFWHELTPQVLCVAFLVGVLGNLVASVLWAVPALVHLHRKLDRHHREHLQVLNDLKQEKISPIN